MTRQIFCIKLQQEAAGLITPPFPGPLGKLIFEQVSQQAWNAWVKHQTLLINEYRLNLSDPKTRIFLQDEMRKYFWGDGSEQPAGFSKPDA